MSEEREGHPLEFTSEITGELPELRFLVEDNPDGGFLTHVLDVRVVAERLSPLHEKVKAIVTPRYKHHDAPRILFYAVLPGPPHAGSPVQLPGPDMIEPSFWNSLSDVERAACQLAWPDDFRERTAALEAVEVGDIVSAYDRFTKTTLIALAKAALPELGISESDSYATVTEAISKIGTDWEAAVSDKPPPPAWDKSDPDLPSIALILRLVAEIENRINLRSTSQMKENQPARRKGLAAEPLTKDGFFLSASDRVNKATIEAFMPGAMQKAADIGAELSDMETQGLRGVKKFWAVYLFESRTDALRGLVGFTKDPGETVWQMLRERGALAVKAQYALWARAFAQTDAEPNKFITISVPHFCDDLGFRKKKRAHTRASKQAAMEVLELLTSLELVMEFQRQGKTIQLRGPLWTRGIVAEERDGYADLFGANRVDSARALWEPVGFSYAPGPFFANPAWRDYNRNVALIGEGLLKLSTENEDKWAVMVGGYIAILARMNGYRRTSVGVRLLLEKTGLWRVDGQHRPGRMRDKLTHALDRIREVGIIRAWQVTRPADLFDADDLSAPETLAGLSEKTQWAKAWLSESVLIDWPDEMERRAVELGEKRERAISRRATRAMPSGTS
jgi:hypothetical protein